MSNNNETYEIDENLFLLLNKLYECDYLDLNEDIRNDIVKLTNKVNDLIYKDLPEELDMENRKLIISYDLIDIRGINNGK